MKPAKRIFRRLDFNLLFQGHEIRFRLVSVILFVSGFSRSIFLRSIFLPFCNIKQILGGKTKAKDQNLIKNAISFSSLEQKRWRMFLLGFLELTDTSRL